VIAARPWTVGALLRYGARRLRHAGLAFGHGTMSARDEAAWLVLHALELPPDAAANGAGRPVGPRAARRALALIERRVRSRKPAAYLTGEAWLGEFRFRVDERVVVPRSHIAGLLRERLAPWIAGRQAIRTALDLCTGSGCLAVLLAHSFPRARIEATDISPAALAVARANVRDYRLGRRVRLLRSDLFSALRRKRYDLIVSNPPYVTSAAMRRLPREYRHEPRRALAGGRDGLDMVRRILSEAGAHLNPGGTLVVEVGAARRRLERAFPRVPFTWPETAAGDSVFVLGREQLPRPTPWRGNRVPDSRTIPATRAGPAPRAAGARRIGRA
jgi:ribosomal protein L3 glutamine methyltransferase